MLTKLIKEQFNSSFFEMEINIEELLPLLWIWRANFRLLELKIWLFVCRNIWNTRQIFQGCNFDINFLELLSDFLPLCVGFGHPHPHRWLWRVSAWNSLRLLPLGRRVDDIISVRRCIHCCCRAGGERGESGNGMNVILWIVGFY